MGYTKRVIGGFGSLLSGMSVTIKELFTEPVTQNYPHVEPELSTAYRSAIKLIRFEETNSHDCVGCLACERICPSFCIKIEGGKVEGIKKKRASKFHMDFALCSLCGLCLDVCPTDTLEYSNLYDEAGFQRNWTFDLLAEFAENEDQFRDEQRVREEKAAEEKKVAAAAKKAKAAAAKAAKAKAAAANDDAKAKKSDDEGAAADVSEKASEEPGGESA